MIYLRRVFSTSYVHECPAEQGRKVITGKLDASTKDVALHNKHCEALQKHLGESPDADERLAHNNGDPSTLTKGMLKFCVQFAHK
jgi:hypothetical protein